MDVQYLIVCCSIFILMAASSIYGVKFLKKRNFLLGFEWLIVAFSATNFLYFFLTGVKAAYSISYFCDAFSRGFGIPIITTAGLMTLTHHYRPSVLMDIVLFAGAVAGTVALVAVDAIAPFKPWYYVAMWSAFSLYQVYFAVRLLNVGETGHAVGVILTMLACQGIAVIYDFYTLPGDSEHMVFYILAVLAWSFLCVETYYAYCALERAEKKSSACDQRHMLYDLERQS